MFRTNIVMHKASTVLAAGADFRLMGTQLHPGQIHQAGGLGVRGAHRFGQEPDHPARFADPARMGYKVAAIRHPMPYGDLVKQAVQRFADLHRPGQARMHDRRARRIRTPPG